VSNVKRIESRDNPTFKALRALAEDHREQRRQGKTVIVGVHLIEAYRQKIGVPELLVVSERGQLNGEISALLLANQGCSTLLLRDALFRELSEQVTPSGILAVINIPLESNEPLLRSCVLLDAIQDAGNVGSILRSAAAAGVSNVLLGEGCAGVWTPRVLRAAQGAHFDLSLREHCDLAKIVSTYPGSAVAAVAAGGESLYDIQLNTPVAWIFGNEGSGISRALVDLARHRVSIPMAAGCESLNVAAAAAVCLFEGVRQRQRIS
jgi:TrmH family RNA methyltransferase